MVPSLSAPTTPARAIGLARKSWRLALVALLAASVVGAGCGNKRAHGLGVVVLPDGGSGPDLAVQDSAPPGDDAPAETRADAGPAEAGADADRQAAGCPSSSYVDVCGCGCCGQPQSTVCYYPALGDSPATIPNPRPPDCSAVGCSLGVRHVCCDAQVDTRSDFYNYCAYDPATDLPRIVLVQSTLAQSGLSSCATVTLVRQPDANPQPSSIPGWSFESGQLGACGGPSSGPAAIGALGTASLVYAGSSATFTAHLVLFTASASGPVAAAAHRMDVISLPLSTGTCPF